MTSVGTGPSIRPAIEDGRTARHFAVVRAIFGLVWAIDATLKWLPGFRSNFQSIIDEAGHGQPSWLSPWFGFWRHLTAHTPTTFAVVTAVAETVVSLCLLLGAFQRVTFAFGAAFAVIIWGVGEGFGGPYVSGATDIGSAVIYALVFVALWAAVPRESRAAAPGLDQRLARRRLLRWATFH